jgi:hypothetical protein
LNSSGDTGNGAPGFVNHYTSNIDTLKSFWVKSEDQFITDEYGESTSKALGTTPVAGSDKTPPPIPSETGSQIKISSGSGTTTTLNYTSNNNGTPPSSGSKTGPCKGSTRGSTTVNSKKQKKTSTKNYTSSNKIKGQVGKKPANSNQCNGEVKISTTTSNSTTLNSNFDVYDRTTNTTTDKNGAGAVKTEKLQTSSNSTNQLIIDLSTESGSSVSITNEQSVGSPNESSLSLSTSIKSDSESVSKKSSKTSNSSSSSSTSGTSSSSSESEDEGASVPSIDDSDIDNMDV